MKRYIALFTAAALSISLLAGCASGESAETQTTDIKEELGLTADQKEATQYTAEINSAVYDLLDFEDTSEYENATRGLIDAPEALEIYDAEGNVIWSQKAYSFLDEYE